MSGLCKRRRATPEGSQAGAPWGEGHLRKTALPTHGGSSAGSRLGRVDTGPAGAGGQGDGHCHMGHGVEGCGLESTGGEEQNWGRG